MILTPGEKIVLVISDTQCPFEHYDTIPFLEWVVEKIIQPMQKVESGLKMEVVHIGDEADNHGLSRYNKDPDGYSAGHELDSAIEHLEPFYKLFPNVKVCHSNHGSRPMDRAFEAGIPERYMRKLEEVLQFPKGWEKRDEWIVDGVRYVHGHEGLPGGAGAIQQTAMKKTRSTVFGHLHALAGIQYYATEEELKFAMCVGSLVNAKAYAFRYGKKHVNKSIISCGIVDRGVPRIVPMLLDENGRWLYKKQKNVFNVSVRQKAIHNCADCSQRRGKYKRGDGAVIQRMWCRDCNQFWSYEL